MEGAPYVTNAIASLLLLIIVGLLIPGTSIAIAAFASEVSPSSSTISGSASSLSKFSYSTESPQQQLDVLNALGLRETARPGVTLTTGPPGGQPHPAYRLQGEERSLRAPVWACRAAAKLLRDCAGEFTVAAVLRQERDTSGTIIAFSDNADRYLELQSSGRRDEVRLHYTHLSEDNSRHVHIEVFKYELADGKWHKLAVSVSGSQVEMFVDCHSVYRRILKPGPPHRNFTTLDLELWVGQRNKHSFFKGSLHAVSLVSGAHGHSTQCPDANLSCPTCGEFAALRDTVETLAKNVRELAQRLVKAESNVAQLEQCDCIKSCNDNGTTRLDGSSWEIDCDICTCVHGVIECKEVHCPAVNCTYPEQKPGECCKKCMKECYFEKMIYEHGHVKYKESFQDQCLTCTCVDGSMACVNTICPVLDCPNNRSVNVPGKCCKVCTDIDECATRGDTEGHHCNKNSVCKNTQSSYICECLPGYERQDAYNCKDIDECALQPTQLYLDSEDPNNRVCDIKSRAVCNNTIGSYECTCRNGYAGDGKTCLPVCSQMCLNGGTCTAPNKCTCQPMFAGPACEYDVDECAEGTHRCDEKAVCVNMPGWYYCKCKHGYESVMKDDFQESECKDIDECANKTDTCHPTAKCRNTDGGYECICEPGDQHCTLSCMFNNVEILNGSYAAASQDDPCEECFCNRGVISCNQKACNCTHGPVDERCCPQCNPDKPCKHQELEQVEFISGEKWIYRCQTCECLYGEIDCWPMECPPVTCGSEAVIRPGDCCPRCLPDPCATTSPSEGSLSSLDKMFENVFNYNGLLVTTVSNTSKSNRPCRDQNNAVGNLKKDGDSRNGTQVVPEGFRSHGEKWTMDDCSVCECKDGTVCCNFDFRSCSHHNSASHGRNHLAPTYPNAPDVSHENSISQVVRDARDANFQKWEEGRNSDNSLDGDSNGQNSFTTDRTGEEGKLTADYSNYVAFNFSKRNPENISISLDNSTQSFGYVIKYNISSIAKQFIDNITRYAINYQNSKQTSTDNKISGSKPRIDNSFTKKSGESILSKLESTSEEFDASSEVATSGSELYHDLETEVGEVIKELSYGHVEDLTTKNKEASGINYAGVKKYISGAINWQNIPKRGIKFEDKSRTNLEKDRGLQVTQQVTVKKKGDQVTTEVTNAVTSDGRTRAPG